jgi:hypothetical protein
MRYSRINNLLFVLFIFMVTSCENKEDDQFSNLKNLTNLEGESGLSFDESYSKWNALKKENDNSYIYQTSQISWTGFGSVTELRIEKGVIKERNYAEYMEYWTPSRRKIIDSYSENYTNLGSHEKGADLLTIDDLYNSCSNNYLTVDTDNNTLYFKTTTNGLMTSCGYVPNNCMDDCFFGVTIMSFEWL